MRKLLFFLLFSVAFSAAAAPDCSRGFQYLARWDSYRAEHFPTAPLPHSAYVIDTNILMAIALAKENLPLNAAREAYLNRLSALLNLSRQELLDHDIEKFALWFPEAVADEISVHIDYRQGNLEFFGHTVAAKYAQEDYDAVMSVLRETRVGTNAGEKDRRVIAELLFSEVEYPGSVPRFVTGDRKVYNALCRLSPLCKSSDLGPVYERFPDGFDVELRDAHQQMHRLHVIPVPTS